MKHKDGNLYTDEGEKKTTMKMKMKDVRSKAYDMILSPRFQYVD